eukprot:4836538-Alexandrium_andersonii.AAC.1
MAWVMLTRLGARSVVARKGGAAASWGTRGITCGGPPSVDTDSALRAQGTFTRPCKTSRGQRSPRGRRATART